MLVFLDESGDSGLKGKIGSSRLFGVTAVLFQKSEEAEKCDARINAVRAELRLSPRFEFHFNRCGDKYRAIFLRSVCRSDFIYYSAVLDKSRLQDESSQDKNWLYKYAANLVLQDAKNRLWEAKVVIDQFGDRAFRNELDNYLRRRINEDKKILIRKVCMEPSHSNNLIQLADMISGAVFRSFDATKLNRMEFRKLIESKEVGVRTWPL